VDEALSAYNKAVSINPQEAGYLNNVGNVLVRYHRFNTTAQKVAVRCKTSWHTCGLFVFRKSVMAVVLFPRIDILT
jgi:hypothetical protein